MKLSIMPRIFQGRKLSLLDCVKICRKAGFDTFDFGISSHVGSCFLYGDDWEAQAKKLAGEIAELGVVFDQSHAPYAYHLYKDLEFYREITRRAVEICAILGGKHIIIHADLAQSKPETYNPTDALTVAYEFYAPFVEQARRLGIGIAIENLFDDRSKRSRFTSTVEEQLAIIDKFNDSCVSACWDVGHGHVMYGDKHLNEIKKLGNRISCTHVHDNSQKRDLHLCPYLGVINWKEVVGFLKEINYSGSFTYELKPVAFADSLMDTYLKLLYDTGTSLICGEEVAENVV
ncbi:MAG: sugar phosphate isomerase/epimerase [Clostridiales bacterium]|nr:sugar phosphate isomerase/epimerase [Clostridiales bacterium]